MMTAAGEQEDSIVSDYQVMKDIYNIYNDGDLA